MELSIITINRNNRTGLQRTMDSVSGQTYRDFEYIIVDGASTDDSQEVISQYEGKVCPVEWISEADNGIFDAMNKGIRMSQGKYLLFLNSGDVLDNADVLQHVFERHYKADVVIGRCRVFRGTEEVWVSMPQEHYTFNDLFHGSIAHQASFIRKDLFDRYGLYRDDLKIMGDWEFFLRTIVLNNCTVKAYPGIVSRYELDGVSSDEKSARIITQEKEYVYSIHHLLNIVPDYHAFDRRLEQLEALIWASRKSFISKPIEHLFRLAKRLVGK